MGKVYTTSEDLTSVANAIRAKTGSNAAITYPAGFVSEIGNISNEPIELKDVNFIDYDGTLLYSYTKTEAQALTALPDNPSHTRLTAQGWNWSLAEIKTQLTADPNQPIIVGQMYITKSGNTEIDIVLDNPNYLSPCLILEFLGEIEVNWGDNVIENFTHNYSAVASHMHTYNTIGNYTIQIKVNSGWLSLFNSGNTNAGILRISEQNSRQTANHIYNNAIKAVYLGLDTTLGTYVFAGSYYIEYITLPVTITNISSNTFQNCYSLKSIVIPNSITTINSSTFSGCTHLKILSLPHTITKLTLSSTFDSCRQLEYITISNLLNDIGTSKSSSFNNTSNLSYISPLLFTPTTSIPNNMFYNSGIKTITIPSSITSMGDSIFNSCQCLKSMIIPNTVQTIGTSLFNSCYSLTSLTLSNILTSIPASTCSSCQSLKEIIIPNTVTSIGSYAFYNCASLTNITIPENVTSIGDYAFSSSSSITEYHIKPTTPPTAGSSILGSASSLVTIYVPYSADHSTLEAYKTANNWSYYANQMIEEPAPTE